MSGPQYVAMFLSLMAVCAIVLERSRYWRGRRFKPAARHGRINKWAHLKHRLLLAQAIAWVVRSVYGRLWWLERHAQSEKSDKLVCSNCGYDLSHLELPRCPECGALRGFRVPLDQLGLTEAEVRAGFERQRKRRAAESKRGSGGGHTGH